MVLLLASKVKKKNPDGENGINEEDTDLSLWKNLMEKLMFCGRAHVDDALLSFPLPCQREISQQWMW